MHSPAALIGYVSDLVVRGGPEPSDYPELLEVFDALQAQRDDTLSLARACIDGSDGAFNSRQTLQGHVCLRPYGYHGDFDIIDRIYLNDVASDPRLAQWDEFFHWGTAAVAVRNRKTFFLDHYVPRFVEARADVRMLNVGSGPCRDVSELLIQLDNQPVAIDCLDADDRGFAHARDIIGLDDSRVTYIHRNALRLGGPARYDAIWSAGLFDYLDDELFVTLARRLGRLLSPGGEMVLGNFSLTNTQAGYMAFGGWMLQHRSADHLLSLANKAGFGAGRTEVLQEPSGVNLFLHVRSA